MNTMKTTELQTEFVSAEKLNPGWRLVTVKLQNNTNQVIRIVGSQGYCSYRPELSEVMSISSHDGCDFRFFLRDNSKAFQEGTLPLFVEKSGRIVTRNVPFAVLRKWQLFLIQNALFVTCFERTYGS